MELERLRHWSQILLWLSVILPLLGGLAAATRFYVDRHAASVASALQKREVEIAKEDATTAKAAAAHIASMLEIANAEHKTEQKALRTELGEAEVRVGQLREAATPRVLTPEQVAGITGLLKRCSGKDRRVRFATVAGDREAHAFAESIAKLFKLAGWTVEGPGNTFTFTPFPGMVLGVSSADASPDNAAMIQKGFDSLGLPLPGQVNDSLASDQIQILVGNKVPRTEGREYPPGPGG